jgi:predicted nucleic acid-binding protein
MPVYFFDTSALVKRYHIEAGSETVNALFDDPDAVFAVASITITEFVSAFTRKLNESVITAEDFRVCLSEFSKDIITSFWVIDLDRSHINKGVSLIIKHNLRTLDSLQLAVFLNLSPAKPAIVTSDEALYNAALKEDTLAIKP